MYLYNLDLTSDVAIWQHCEFRLRFTSHRPITAVGCIFQIKGEKSFMIRTNINRAAKTEATSRLFMSSSGICHHFCHHGNLVSSGVDPGMKSKSQWSGEEESSERGVFTREGEGRRRALSVCRDLVRCA